MLQEGLQHANHIVEGVRVTLERTLEAEEPPIEAVITGVQDLQHLGIVGFVSRAFRQLTDAVDDKLTHCR